MLKSTGICEVREMRYFISVKKMKCDHCRKRVEEKIKSFSDAEIISFKDDVFEVMTVSSRGEDIVKKINSETDFIASLK